MSTTPYCNDDGDWWIRTDQASYIEARRLVRGFMDDPKAYVLHYVGREMARLTEHETGCTCEGDFDGDGSCYSEHDAWHFQENER